MTAVEAVYTVGSAIFTLLLAIAGASTGWRMLQLHRAGEQLPALIWRDVLVMGGLAAVFAVSFWHAAAGRPFSDETWWAPLLVSVACAAVTVYDVFDLFVIGHRWPWRKRKS